MFTPFRFLAEAALQSQGILQSRMRSLLFPPRQWRLRSPLASLLV
jgi:hypothetical protein